MMVYLSKAIFDQMPLASCRGPSPYITGDSPPGDSPPGVSEV